MKKINLMYWNESNFGDLLNPELIKELTGLEIQYKEYQPSRKKKLKKVLRCSMKLEFSKLKTVSFPWQKTLICIGSILSWSNSNTIVWGAGFMNSFEVFKGGRVLAIRGKYTALKLKEKGFTDCNVYGDPALLLPLWLQPKCRKKYKIGIIPHWSETDYFIEQY